MPAAARISDDDLRRAITARGAGTPAWTTPGPEEINRYADLRRLLVPPAQTGPIEVRIGALAAHREELLASWSRAGELLAAEYETIRLTLVRFSYHKALPADPAHPNAASWRAGLYVCLPTDPFVVRAFRRHVTVTAADCALRELIDPSLPPLRLDGAARVLKPARR